MRIGLLGVSAVLFVGVVGVWVRSHFVSDQIAWRVDWKPPAAEADSTVSERLFERVQPAGVPLNGIVTTVKGRVLSYRQSPFS
jgi:hypothetical protein